MTVDVARQQMKSYWEGHSSAATVETMMLDSHAKALTQLELPEILGKAPYMENKDVLELAAGIGRYTSVIAKRAKSVTAVEFIEDFIKVNADNNAHLGNVNFLCKDVVNLEAEPNSFDVIFSNWIFMYMEDEEAANSSSASRALNNQGISKETPIPRITAILPST
ncbi:hypothetical protein ON010_g6481 [Phytophthora cinnamomi]|nr:hypothetical protein ON010_g6481 [Phytophthora cinnamomi]